MTAEVIAIGSELTCGASLDTNSQWISQQLESLGWTVARHTTLSDTLEVIANEFRLASQRSRVVIITGGLGPTLDDITRDGMALAFGQRLVHDADSMSHIEALFQSRGRQMPERNRRQAQRPEHAAAIPNSCGTAPGVLMRIRADDADSPSGTWSGGCLMAALPGVPVEMKTMFTDHIQPLLLSSGSVAHRVLIRTFGLGESEVEQRLGDLTERGRNPEVGITASEAIITLSVTARAATADECGQLLQPIQDRILERLGSAVFAIGDNDLQQCVADELRRKRHRIACIEGASTGGLIAHWLCDDPLHDDFLADARLRYGPSAADLMSMQSEPDIAWERLFRDEAQRLLSATGVDFVVLTSAKWDSRTPTGVLRRHGFVAVVGRDEFNMLDVTMTGNLAIFRGRAARMALNCLRLLTFERP